MNTSRFSFEAQVANSLEEELALLYQAKGIEQARARSMARDIMQNPEQALTEKVREELGIAQAHSTPLKEGWVTGIATAIAIPVMETPQFQQYSRQPETFP